MTNTAPRAPRPTGRLLSWLLLAIVSSLIMVAFAILPPKRLDNVLYDILARANERPADPSILIVDIDDRSLAQLGAWPWSRETHARMVDRLTEAGAKTIVYDVLFSEAGDPAQDQALGEAIKRSGRVYLPQFLADAGADAPPRVVDSIPAIAQGAAGVGLAHVRFDDDGVAIVDVGYSEVPSAIAFDSDGRILVAGIRENSSYERELIVARINADGSLDASFGTDGVATITAAELACGIAVLANGSIVVAGQTRTAEYALEYGLAQLLPDGSGLDTSFGNGGIVGEIANFLGQTLNDTTRHCRRRGRSVQARDRRLSGDLCDGRFNSCMSDNLSRQRQFEPVQRPRLCAWVRP